MNHTKNYPLYAVAAVAGGGVALWAGISPLFLLVLLVCPPMMFFMMRGMSGGHDMHGSDQQEQEGSGSTRSPDVKRP